MRTLKLNKIFENLRKWFKFNTEDSWKPMTVKLNWGPGIRQQMLEAKVNTEVYSNFTMEKLEEILLDLTEGLKERSERQMIARTGKRGALSYLETFYRRTLVFTEPLLSKEDLESKVQVLVDRDEKEMKEGIYRIDSTGLYYEGTYNK